MSDKPVIRMPRAEVERAVEQQIPAIMGHLDLEGFCYIKITRTSGKDCFAADLTSQVLKGEEPAGGPQTQEEISRMWWRHPAREKWAMVEATRKK